MCGVAEIRFENVAKRYGSVDAVDGISFTAHDKEFVVLVGPSGCGKTTTLRMIAGLELPDSGEIYVGDRRVNNVAPKDRNVAMVFQDYALYPHMSVFKNMSFALQLKKYPKEEINRRVNETAKILGIEELLDRRPKQLSGGQRQRVAMGRAIVRNPQAFLFDEPLSNLDAKLRVQMRKELARLHETLEITIVYVTHDQVEAMTLADRIVIMDGGRIMQIGAPLDVFNKPKNLFVAGFIGSPAMNFLDVRVFEKNGGLALKGEAFELDVPAHCRDRFSKAADREAILGIRPQHIYDKAVKRLFQGAQSLRMTVEIIEPMGVEVIVYGCCGSAQLTACVSPKTLAAPHQESEMLVDMNQVHLFDKATGQAY
jgi:multiple sugar transport system ATP-binding protein